MSGWELALIIFLVGAFTGGTVVGIFAWMLGGGNA